MSSGLSVSRRASRSYGGCKPELRLGEQDLDVLVGLREPLGVGTGHESVEPVTTEMNAHQLRRQPLGADHIEHMLRTTTPTTALGRGAVGTFLRRTLTLFAADHARTALCGSQVWVSAIIPVDRSEPNRRLSAVRPESPARSPSHGSRPATRPRSPWRVLPPGQPLRSARAVPHPTDSAPRADGPHPNRPR